ncbi:hypothetical protein FQN50_000629 [Emmonsiellopsis sp. PD_5]|nr:hypothetical protein FQN50_000629 [Emmonsiellopsis sp. PD_5]
MFQCQGCGVSIQFEQNYLQHVKTGQDLRCVDCPSRFDSLCALRSHRQLVHASECEKAKKLMRDPLVRARLFRRHEPANIGGLASRNEAPQQKEENVANMGGLVSRNEAPQQKEENVANNTENLDVPETGDISSSDDFFSCQSFLDGNASSVDPVQNEFLGGKGVSSPKVDLLDLCDPEVEDKPTELATSVSPASTAQPHTQPGDDEEKEEAEVKIDEVSTTAVPIALDVSSSDASSSDERSEPNKSDKTGDVEEDNRGSSVVSEGSDTFIHVEAPVAETTDQVKGTEQPGKSIDSKASAPDKTQTGHGLDPQTTTTEQSIKESIEGSKAPTTNKPGIDRGLGQSVVCPVCEATFCSRVSLHQHQVTKDHTYCKLCLGSFASRKGLKRHVELVHSFKCPLCPEVYSSVSEVQEHQKKSGHAYCSPCNCYFLDVASSTNHTKKFHEKNFKCPLCPEVYSSSSEVQEHQHKSGHAYCNSCKCYFLDAAGSITHAKFHEQVFRFHCPTCGIGFATEAAQGQHQKSNNHAYCKRCDEPFNSESTAKKHTGVPHPFPCQTAQCNCSFPDIRSLLRHQEKTSHKQFYCNECNRQFGSELALGYHEVGSHGFSGACKTKAKN